MIKNNMLSCALDAQVMSRRGDARDCAVASTAGWAELQPGSFVHWPIALNQSTTEEEGRGVTISLVAESVDRNTLM